MLQDFFKQRKYKLQAETEFFLLSPSLRRDKSFILRALQENPDILDYIDSYLFYDADFVLKAVKYNPKALHYAYARLKNNPKFVLEAVRRNPWALRFANRYFLIGQWQALQAQLKQAWRSSTQALMAILQRMTDSQQKDRLQKKALLAAQVDHEFIARHPMSLPSEKLPVPCRQVEPHSPIAEKKCTVDTPIPLAGIIRFIFGWPKKSLDLVASSIHQPSIVYPNAITFEFAEWVPAERNLFGVAGQVVTQWILSGGVYQVFCRRLYPDH